jgi:hypothetical protein
MPRPYNGGVEGPGGPEGTPRPEALEFASAG